MDELLELVSLDPDDTRDRYPAQLSGGQRQRIGVARALAVDPPLMLMDEPFGAIDPINRERLQNEFLRLQHDLRKTIVFVTHDIDEAIKIGDRIAVLQQGGHLAQFATPAELLMYPANKFVEDFVGADRALKRLSLQRVSDIDLWKAACVRVGEPVSEARAKLEDADIEYLLVVDENEKPKGWLSERGLPGRAGDRGLPLEGRAGGGDGRRAARRPLRPARDRDPLRRRGGRRGQGAGHPLARGDQPGAPGAPGGRAPRGGRVRGRGLTVRLDLPIAAKGLQTEDRTGGTCEANNGFCPDWIYENFDRYVDPFVQHVFLTVTSVAIGFVIAFGLALLAHQKRWLLPPLSASSQVLYAVPSAALFLLLLPITGRGTVTGLIALVSYTLIFVFVNVTTGLDGVPEDSIDAARGMGLTERQLLWRVKVPLALPEIFAGLRIATTTTVGLAALAFLAGAGGLGEEINRDKGYQSNVAVAGGLAIGLALVLDLLILTVQRFLTPWRKAAA